MTLLLGVPYFIITHFTDTIRDITFIVIADIVNEIVDDFATFVESRIFYKQLVTKLIS